MLYDYVHTTWKQKTNKPITVRIVSYYNKVLYSRFLCI